MRHRHRRRDLATRIRTWHRRRLEDNALRVQATRRGVEEGAVVDAGGLGGGVAAVWGLIELGDCAGDGVVAASVGCGVDFGDGCWTAGLRGADDDGAGDRAERLGEGGAGGELVG